MRYRLMCLSAAAVAMAGCNSCPPFLTVMLGDGQTVTANQGSGAEAQSNSVWTFFVEAPITSLPLFGAAVEVPAMAFKAEFGANGELIRVFDNQVLVPETLGEVLLIDGILHSGLEPLLFYQAQSYGSQEGSAVGLKTCSLIYGGPLQVMKAEVGFAGTLDALQLRSDGTLTFTTEVNPFLQPFLPPEAKSQTIEIGGFALRDVLE